MEWTHPLYTLALFGHDSCAMATIATQGRVRHVGNDRGGVSANLLYGFGQVNLQKSGRDVLLLD
jgi:hypothetical protein